MNASLLLWTIELSTMYSLGSTDLKEHFVYYELI